MADFPSSLRNARYAVSSVLGEGSQAQTLAAVDKLHGRPVAIKRFVVRGARSWKDVELAEREAQVLAAVSHPHLPAYVEHFEENGELYLVMEHVQGDSLYELRRRGRRLERAELLRLLGDLGALLDYLHGLAPAVVHRDIKPGNVIRRPDGSFALVDFGSVRDRLRPDGGSTVVGTFGYMAPEQFQGRALPQSDVYALAVTALSLATGEEPEHLPHQGLRLDAERALPGDPELAHVLAQMLEPDPDRRPHRVLPLLATLEGGVNPRPTRGHRSGAHPRASARPSAQSGEPVPPIVLFVMLLGLRIARIAVRLSVGFLVPVLLAVLAIAFGPRLRRAARHVREASRRADHALVRASDVVRRLRIGPAHESVGPPGAERVRVSSDSRTSQRVRVVDTTAEDVTEEDTELADFDERLRQRRAAPPERGS